MESQANSFHTQHNFNSRIEILENKLTQVLENNCKILEENHIILEENRIILEENRKFRDDLQAKDAYIHQLEERIQTLEKTIKSHKKTIELHKKTIESHKKTIESHKKTIESLQNKVKSQEKTIQSLRSEVASLTIENGQLRKALAGSNGALSSIRHRIILDEACQLILKATNYPDWQSLRHQLSKHELKNCLLQSGFFAHPPLHNLAMGLIYESNNQVRTAGNQVAHEASEELLQESLATVGNRERPAMKAILMNVHFWNEQIKQCQTVPCI